MNTGSIQTVKGMLTKVVIAGALAGALMVAAPQQAAAQGFAVQFGVGSTYGGSTYDPGYGQVYGGDRYGRSGYDAGFYGDRRRQEFEAARRREAWEQHQRWEQRERWERERAYGQRFDDRGRGYGYYGR